MLAVHLVVPQKLVPDTRSVDAERIDDDAWLVAFDREAKHPHGPFAQRADLESVWGVR
jgi:hypothetical protein